LYGLYIARAEFDHASALGEHVLRLAEYHQDRTLLIGAHEVRSCTLFHLGQFVRAHTHMEAGVTLYVPDMHDTLVTLYGVDVGILCHSWSALTLCVPGYLDQGLQRNNEARARAVAHPFTLAYTLLYAAFVHYVRKEIQCVREQTEALLALATEYGFVDCLHQGMVLHGWACVLQGQYQDGLAEMHQGLDGYRASGQTMDRPYYLALLAEAYGCQGQAEAGLAALAEALSMVGAMPGYPYEAVLYQLQGALLHSVPPDRRGVTQTPEACFQQALTIAHRQQAKAWELRAAISLSRLWQQQGKRAEAYALLLPIYAWFTEGFDTAALQAARALLETLG
jgi:predicted ATPase